MRLITVVLVMLLATPAVAWESWLDESRASVSYSTDGYEYRLRRSGYRPRQYQYRQRRYQRYYPPSYGYAAPRVERDREYRSEYGSHSATCYAAIRVVGSQGLSEEAAEASAHKGWMEAVRWKHGEAAMDIGNARGSQKRCSRSSIGEVLDKTFHRCEYEARPCRPRFEDGK